MITGQGKMETTPAGALRESNKHRGRFDLIPYEAMEALAIWYELGAEKYDERNWENGLSVKDCINRMCRHSAKAASGWTDENHLAAVIWNAAAAITMMRRRPDLNDHRWIQMDKGAEKILVKHDFAESDEIHEHQNKSLRVYPDLNEFEKDLQELLAQEFGETHPFGFEKDGVAYDVVFTIGQPMIQVHKKPDPFKQVTDKCMAQMWPDLDKDPLPDPKALAAIAKTFSDGLATIGRTAMGLTVDEFREYVLGLGTVKSKSDELKKKINSNYGMKAFEKGEVNTTEANLLYKSVLDRAVAKRVEAAEQATVEKILGMFQSVASLQDCDREYLSRCLIDGRVESLDAVKQFLDKIKEDRNGTV